MYLTTTGGIEGITLILGVSFLIFGIYCLYHSTISHTKKIFFSIGIKKSLMYILVGIMLIVARALKLF